MLDFFLGGGGESYSTFSNLNIKITVTVARLCQMTDLTQQFILIEFQYIFLIFFFSSRAVVHVPVMT